MRGVSIGEFMLEFSKNQASELYLKKYAGDSFNFCYYFNNASKSNSVSLLSAVGNDYISADALKYVQEHGVATDYVKRNPEKTIGNFIIDNDEQGEKIYSYWRSDSAARFLFDEVHDLSEFDL